MHSSTPQQDPQSALYARAVADHGAALARLARAYEAEPARREDLLQEIHLALWRSLAAFDGRCSPRTWVYRVAHNVAASHVAAERRSRRHDLVSLEDIQDVVFVADASSDVHERIVLDQVLALIERLRPLDRQIMLLYLESLDASAIGEITGLSPANVATKVSRIKKLLTTQMNGATRT